MFRKFKRIAALTAASCLLFTAGCSVNADGSIDLDGTHTVTIDDIQKLVESELPEGWDTTRIFQNGEGQQIDSGKILDILSGAADQDANGETDYYIGTKNVPSFAQFETEDINGNPVNQDIFKDYDVTMVNVWATWCYYCVEEMPGISALYEELPENVNIITICEDGDTAKADALNVLNNVAAHFTTIKPGEDLEKSALKYVQGFPTTFFVNSKGEVIGKTQVGAPATTIDGVKSAYTDLINKALEEIKKD